jgi:hypothetical protein
LETSELSRIPDTTVPVADADTARKLLNLMEDFEDHDDVQEVFANFDIPDDILSQIYRETADFTDWRRFSTTKIVMVRIWQSSTKKYIFSFMLFSL